MCSNELEARCNEKRQNTSRPLLFSSLFFRIALSLSLFHRFSSVCLLQHAYAPHASHVRAAQGVIVPKGLRDTLEHVDRFGDVLAHAGADWTVSGTPWCMLVPSCAVSVCLGVSRASEMPLRECPRRRQEASKSIEKSAQDTPSTSSKRLPDEPRHPSKFDASYFFNVSILRKFRSTSWQLMTC